MDRKEIYEHLANIYLDASAKKSKKSKRYQKLKNIFIVSLAFVSGLSLFLLINIYRNRVTGNTQVALVLHPDILKINFNFDPAKKEILTINLNKLNLSRYDRLGFSIKKVNFYDKISLRVELTNAFNEKSFVYLADIPHKWKEYEIKFPDFKNITDWSEMTALAFVVEEWNVKEKKDIVYIDNVRVLR